MPHAPLPTSGDKFSISVLSTHSSDSSPSLLVTFDNRRYLFNTPEAISRIALQSKVGLRKVGNVFLGSLQDSAGLPGFILSSVEAGNNKIEIVGPVGTDHYLASCRFFTRRDKLSLKVTSSDTATSSSTPPPDSLPVPVYSDANVNVYSFTSTSHSAPIPPVPTSSLKRKRSSSPSSPTRPHSPPRSNSPMENQPSRSSRSPSPSRLDPSSPSFQPSKLTGAAASAWRSAVLRDMFRGSAFDTSNPLTPTQTVPSSSEIGTNKERRGPTPAYLPQSLPSFSAPTEAMSYLVVGPAQSGKFLPGEAVKRGVNPGKSFSRLKNGERVWVRTMTEEEKTRQGMNGSAISGAKGTKETKKERAKRLKEEKMAQEEADSALEEGVGEGNWVKPEDCMGPGQDASAFLILNIPSPAYLTSLSTTLPPSLLSNASLGPSTALRTVFYLLGPRVVDHPQFQLYHSSLRAALSTDVHFRMSSADCINQGRDEITFGPSALLNLRLSKLDDNIFNVPHYSFVDPSKHSLSPDISTLVNNTHFISTDNLLPSATSPLGGEIRSFNFKVPSETAEIEASRLKGSEKPLELQNKAKAAWEEYLRQVVLVKDNIQAETIRRLNSPAAANSTETTEGAIEVTPLGTGSAIPSKYRNVSSTLVHLPGTPDATGVTEDYILLDAGEGTWGQLARRFGSKGSQEVLRKIKVIFISHLHQDHHAGLSTLLQQRAQLSPPVLCPLTIVAPPNARTYLLEQNQLFDLGLSTSNIRFIDNFYLEPGKTLQPGTRQAQNYNEVLSLLNLDAITAVPVLHRCRAWGVVITHSSGWRIVFSGDTMPCDALVDAGQNASLLIHEATIEDDLPEVAKAKGHSTFAQAIDVATRMRARHLLLTHFSARYPKLPPLSTLTTSPDLDRPTIATAFDLMTLKLTDFWKIEQYRTAMDALLSWDEAGGDGKSEEKIEIDE